MTISKFETHRIWDELDIRTAISNSWTKPAGNIRTSWIERLVMTISCSFAKWTVNTLFVKDQRSRMLTAKTFSNKYHKYDKS